MADNSSASDNDNTLLTDSIRISCNAETQTPQMPRHVTTSTEPKIPIVQQPPPSSSSFVVLRVENTKDITDFEKEARALAIPDVVVEYIKDSYTLTGDNDDYDQNLGASNPAFEGSEHLSRTPSRSSLRDYQKSDPSSHSGSVSQLNTKFYDETTESDVGLLNVVGQNSRMYHSMPRNVAKKLLLDDFKIHSQPSSPRLPRFKVDGSGMEAYNSNFTLYPAPNGIGFAAPATPNFGYRPLESETSAVYTIIKTCINTNDMKGIHFLPAVSDSLKSTPRGKRKFEFVPAPPQIENKRRRLQCLTDACSLMFFLPGLLMALLTPILIIPMFMYPITYFLQLALLFVGSGAVSACILFISGFIGNMVWYYDDKSKKLRLKLHCGTGPLRHFWGNGFYYWSDEAQAKKEKEMII